MAAPSDVSVRRPSEDVIVARDVFSDGAVAVLADVAAMGGRAQVTVLASAEQVDALVDYALARLVALERCWSRFLPDSELCRLNACAGAPAVVSADLFRAVRTAVDAWYQTGGRYDPTVGAALRALGYTCSWLDLDLGAPPPGLPLPAPGCEGIELLDSVPVVRLPSGVELDLGGLGKGLAADVVVEELCAHGALGAAVTVGGDLRCAGRAPHGDAWAVVIDDDERELAHSALPIGGAVATSGPGLRAFADGRHHIIDPATGLATSREVSQVSVIATTCAAAEVWATAATVAGLSQAAGVLESAEVAGLIVSADGSVEAVSMPDHLVTTV